MGEVPILNFAGQHVADAISISRIAFICLIQLQNDNTPSQYKHLITSTKIRSQKENMVPIQEEATQQAYSTKKY